LFLPALFEEAFQDFAGPFAGVFADRDGLLIILGVVGTGRFRIIAGFGERVEA
jgi:hypothetical protein